MTSQKPPQIKDLLKKICECIDQEKVFQTKHAIKRQNERKIEWHDALHILKTGRHEKDKTIFDDIFNGWKYAIRGKTLDDDDVRIIITFDKDEMFIITIMYVSKL